MKVITPGVDPARFDADGRPIRIVLPASPPLLYDEGWLIGQHGDREVTQEERMIIANEMVHFAEGCWIEERYGDNRNNIVWSLDGHMHWALWVRVWFRSTEKYEEDFLIFYPDNREDGLEFFYGRMNWWWFLGDRIEKIGQYLVEDPCRITRK